MPDLHFTADTADPAERAAVDEVLGGDPVVVELGDRLVRAGDQRTRERRHLLLPALHALQRVAGWISPGGLNYVSDQLQVPPAETYGVATFYELLRTEAPTHDGPTVHVCVDAACQIAGADELVASLSAAGDAVHRAPCLGQCERAPARFVQGRGGPDSVPADGEPFSLPQAGEPGLRLLRRIGDAVDPTDLAAYRAAGGYEALARAIELGPEAVIEQVTQSGLSGRGGAAFPTGVKWRAVRAETGRPRHVVANCDESEPGTFKDRIVMERDPFAVVEALTVAGVAVGAEQGWIYVRGEYPLAVARLQSALDAARSAGLLGDDVAGRGHRFDVEIRRGGGAYICGEETALFNSIEGFRGEPRNKPPFPTTHGLFGQPTAINNPETLLNVLEVLRLGVEEYRSVGTEASPGTKLFCLSGRVGRAGLYEVPFGTTLGALLERAGGVTGSLRAVLLGGAAGSFVTPDALGMPLTLEDTGAAGASLGSGVVMAFDEGVDLTDVVVRIAEFFRHESCGQCVPCRVGTVRQHEVLVELRQKGSLAADRLALVDDMARAMTDASICGLGQTAASAVRSALAAGLLQPGSS